MRTKRKILITRREDELDVQYWKSPAGQNKKIIPIYLDTEDETEEEEEKEQEDKQNNIISALPDVDSDDEDECRLDSQSQMINIFELNCGHTTHNTRLKYEKIARLIYALNIDIAIFVEVGSSKKFRSNLSKYLSPSYALVDVSYKCVSYYVYMVCAYRTATIDRIESDKTAVKHQRPQRSGKGNVFRMCRWTFVMKTLPIVPFSLFCVHQHRGGNSHKGPNHQSNYTDHLKSFLKEHPLNIEGLDKYEEQIFLVGDFNMRPSNVATHYGIDYDVSANRFAFTDTGPRTTPASMAPKTRKRKNGRVGYAIDNIIVYQGEAIIIESAILNKDGPTTAHYTAKGRYVDTDTELGSNHYAITATILLPRTPITSDLL
jgi:hypothetical protein